MFELKQQSRNYRHVGNFPTCRQMSCGLDTLADTTFSCVCDVTSDVSRHIARHDTECRHLGTKTTRRHPTYGAKAHTTHNKSDCNCCKADGTPNKEYSTKSANSKKGKDGKDKSYKGGWDKQSISHLTAELGLVKKELKKLKKSYGKKRKQHSRHQKSDSCNSGSDSE